MTEEKNYTDDQIRALIPNCPTPEAAQEVVLDVSKFYDSTYPDNDVYRAANEVYFASLADNLVMLTSHVSPHLLESLLTRLTSFVFKAGYLSAKNPIYLNELMSDAVGKYGSALERHTQRDNEPHIKVERITDNVRAVTIRPGCTEEELKAALDGVAGEFKPGTSDFHPEPPADEDPGAVEEMQFEDDGDENEPTELDSENPDEDTDSPDTIAS